MRGNELEFEHLNPKTNQKPILKANRLSKLLFKLMVKYLWTRGIPDDSGAKY